MKITFNNKYDCKLTTRALLAIEEDLGINPLNSLFEDDMPKLTVLITILYHSLKACDKNTTKEDTYDIFDEYCEGEGDIMELSKFIYQLYKASGLVKLPDIPSEEEATEGTEKN